MGSAVRDPLEILTMHPTKIGPYSIDRKIGSGGMGNVYHGVHEKTGESVAVKVLPASMAREEGFVLRFSREIQALRKLSNPHIVRLYEDGKTDDGSYYYSMDFVDGETLTSLVSRRRKLPWQEVIEITLQIASALKAAHDAGIVHRDLKPSNLMVSRDGDIKLTDFGVAHVFATTRLTRTGGVVGTAEYMSPEQARGKQATKRSDLYSLGAVMYVMLTGRPPFTGKMASDILHQHQFAQFDKPTHYVPDLPPKLEDFVCTLLEKKPEDRFPDALVLIRKLQNVRSLIEYKDREAEKAVTATGDVSTSDHTAMLASDRTRVGPNSSDTVAPVSDGRGPATMIRDVMRSEIDRRMHKSGLARFFDNTFVLIASLALVLGVGWYLMKASVPTPRDMFARAERIMAARPGSSWVMARSELLEPLLKDQSLAEQQPQLELWLRQVDQYEFCRSLKMSSLADESQESEIHRLVLRAFDRYRGGETIEATQQLLAVKTIIGDDPNYEYLAEFIDDELESWSKNSNNQARQALLQQVLNDAQKKLNEDEPDQAATLLRSALSLYENDSVVATEVRHVRELLNSISESLPAETSDNQ